MPILNYKSSLQAVFGESALEERKTFFHGTHRALQPQQTLQQVSPKLRSMGITRVANVTGLDCIGIPVTMVVRPNSRSLAVSQGKGLSLLSAQVSGIMESIENYHAERIERPLRLSDEQSLRATAAVAPTARLPKSREKIYHDAVRLLWIEARDLFSAESLWLPYELVHTDFTLPRATGSGYFPANTNGLASGNRSIEAALHALCEVIERDAITLWYLQRNSRRSALDTDTVDDPEVITLLQRLQQAGMQLRIWDATADTGIACFNCLIVGDDAHLADPEFGTGCHPDRSVALMRAITEAVQARTTFIAGSRDDFGLEAYTPAAREQRIASCRQLMAEPCTSVAFSSVPHRRLSTSADDLSWVLERLAAVGIEQALWVDLSLQQYDIPVGKIVVPGLEGVYKGAGSDYVPGQRAQAQHEK